MRHPGASLWVTCPVRPWYFVFAAWCNFRSCQLTQLSKLITCDTFHRPLADVSIEWRGRLTFGLGSRVKLVLRLSAFRYRRLLFWLARWDPTGSRTDSLSSPRSRGPGPINLESCQNPQWSRVGLSTSLSLCKRILPSPKIVAPSSLCVSKIRTFCIVSHLGSLQVWWQVGCAVGNLASNWLSVATWRLNRQPRHWSHH